MGLDCLSQGIHWPTKDEPDREAQELALGRLAATMDSDEEDSAEEDDEGVNPASTESGIFDVEDSGFEGLTFSCRSSLVLLGVVKLM